ncbi:MAG: glycoside hydrolase family 92 protein [Tannerellaceae bacterium]|jgi:predicted alpha-1,2-mannosidase|nr:glycoside hydrolase family 92 protein [Tannerellaceae bacterium]
MYKLLRIAVCPAIILLLAACDTQDSIRGEKTPVDYVNPYMGNISHLLVPTYPTVHLPNSMLRVYPERADFTSDQLHGLPVLVTTHRGTSAFNISPVNSSTALAPIVNYTYDNEKITPYEYFVYLDEAGVEVHYAPSTKSGIYEFNFTEGTEPRIVINTRRGRIRILPDGNIDACQIIDRKNTRAYLYLQTEQKPVSSGILNDGAVTEETVGEGGSQSAVLTFSPEVKTVRLRYGISFIDEEQASKNLLAEINTYNYREVSALGKAAWNEALGRISVSGGSENDKTVFYTSLYRVYERMVNISENGRYFSAYTEGGKVLDDEGSPFYTDDWTWDTFRAAHPLRIIIDPEAEINMVKSFIRMAQQSKEGWMPTFPQITGDSHSMNSNHAVSVVWDAYCKGLRGFDLEAGYQASKAAITKSTLIPWVRAEAGELDRFYNEKGYFPALREGEAEYVDAVSRGEKRQPIAVTLGTSFDDWCLSQMAKELKHDEDYAYFLSRSKNYRNVYNQETGFFHPKDKEGRFIEPFDYRFSGGQGARDYYDENNAWTYRWDVQHNIEQLVQLMGSREKFAANLDATFREPLGKSKFEFFAQLPDQTGNVGQFSMSNEPSLHIPYLYNYAGQPWKTQKRIRSLLAQWFRNDLMGVPGDEDGGGTSAFVVFSALGFYPVTPGLPVYNIGSPLFTNARIAVGGGKYFEIEAKNCSSDNKYIQSATINGRTLDQPWFTHDDIKNGGKLTLVMGDKANTAWGVGSVPPSGE